MNIRPISIAALSLGVLGLVLHSIYRLVAFDPQTGLYAGHPLLPVLIILTLLAAALGIAWGRKLQGKGAALDYHKSGDDLTDLVALADCGLYAAAGVLFLVDAVRNVTEGGSLFALYMPVMQGLALAVSGALGIAARVGLRRTEDRCSALAFQTMLMGFGCTVVLVYFYQSHASDPVVVGFAWPILALAASALAWYEIAAMTQKWRRADLAGGLMVFAVVLCMTALADELPLAVKLVLIGNVVWFGDLMAMNNAFGNA